ncbi:MAG: hypothetical protein KDE26_16770, partial [Bacteroidetes bacterium]|nr:hypothetical protein [Bacteroidota bacterium]
KEKIETVNREMLSEKVDLGELAEEDPDYLLEELLSLKSKYNDEGKLGLFKRKILPKAQKSLLEVRINGRTIRGPQDLGVLQRKLQQTAWIKQLTIVMDNYLSQLGIPGEWDDVLVVYREWEDVINALTQIDKFRSEIKSRNLKPLENTEAYWNYLEGLPAYLDLRTQENNWKNHIEPLNSFPETVHPVMQHIISGWQNRDLEAVELGLEEMYALQKEQEMSDSLHELSEELQKIFPGTVAAILDGDVHPFTNEELQWEIYGKKLTGFLERMIDESGNPNQSLATLSTIHQQKENLICQLIAEKTWANKQATITDEQRSSLTAWRNDLINIGKGYGKNTERNMKSAVANMQLAREVVPIWIMQQQTAISFFSDPQPGQFDLLIVDEASQCDISMLNLIFRCKKVIVVGDENQTSVANQAKFFPLGRTNQLLDRYLLNHPFKQQFNINNRSTSIYTLSGVIYPNIISLREHFRCRPELIGFSNKYVYNSHIVPLRTSTENHYGKATEVHYIEDDPNDLRKPAIVKSAIQLIEGLIEDVKAGHLPEIPSLGILCLESSNEAHREYLIRELGKNKLIKAHADELKLLVGTSREFQGDERDIMLLTTTASHKFSPAGKIKPPRAVLGEEMMRIYNVAASRARDKAILLHSIHPEAVAQMNPDCYRRRLIEYFTMTGEDFQEESGKTLGMHPKTGEIGKEFYHWANEQNWGAHLHPQFKIGPYSIDLAIIKGGNKIAIFIDGQGEINPEQMEKSLRQQLVLERAGWKCYRVQAMHWMIDREKVEREILEIFP